MPFKDLERLDAEQRYDALNKIVSDMVRASKGSDDIKYLRDVAKGKIKTYEAVISGIAIIENVVSSDIPIKMLILCPDHIYTERAQSLVASASIKAQKTLAVTESTFALIAAKKNSNGMAALIDIPVKTIDEADPESINVVMDSLELPGNVGTIMRTADGAGMGTVIITNPKVRLNNTTLLSASRGAFAKLNIVVDSVENITSWAKKHGVKIFLADTRAENIHSQSDMTDRVLFVLGCERYGIDENWYKKEHELLKIPMLGICDSLNVGVAGSILIYEALRQQSSL